MTTKKAEAGKKAGATKKPDLKVVEGGKGTAAKPAAEAKAKPAAKGAKKLLLGDSKTEFNVEAGRKALAVYGVAVKADAKPEEVLKLLRAHLGEKLAKLSDDEKVRCDNVCGEISTNETDFCPFCGDEGEDEDAAGAAEAATGGASSDEGGAPPASSDDEGAPPASTTGVALAANAKEVLDESVERINVLRTDLARNSYDLGLELRKIHEGELWKARGHESFKAFVEKDLEIARPTAYKLIALTSQFDRATFEKVGSRKLALISGVEDTEAREQALEQARAGANTKEIERLTSEAKGKPAAPPKSSSTPAAPPKKSSGNEITLLTKVGARAQVVGWRSATSGRPINQHKDDAYAEIPLSEDVRMRVALKQDKEGGIVGLSYSFVRIE